MDKKERQGRRGCRQDRHAVVREMRKGGPHQRPPAPADIRGVLQDDGAPAGGGTGGPLFPRAARGRIRKGALTFLHKENLSFELFFVTLHQSFNLQDIHTA